MTASPATSEIQAEEIARVAALQDELHLALPDVDVDTIKRWVGEVWSAFRNATVRDFVPLLVRREVLAELSPRGTATS
jgi:hypothetical protein